ncbi:BTB/POZ domain-containing protein KCTD15-like [Patiria miniata]|uniref:BTB domain-containing protein n=1 Tax=Patiria miniata TaxID=46514 RepID=A0A913ZH22_PATMI|nr:BTB/POZ domain-containing protein KCTD15-like [Patiria miniata]
MEDIVRLDVGGVNYTTSRSTLTRYPNNMLYCMFNGPWQPAARDADGTYIIDRDGPTFRVILNFLRNGKLCLPKDFKDWSLLEAESNFYQIQELVNAVATFQQELAIEEAMKDREDKLAQLKEREEARAARECEFIEIVAKTRDVAKKGRFKYIGSQKTLESIPYLLQFLIPYGPPTMADEYFLLEDVERNGEAEEEREHALIQEDPMKRMTIFQQVTKLGFELVSASPCPDGESESWVFCRPVQRQ